MNEKVDFPSGGSRECNSLWSILCYESDDIQEEYDEETLISHIDMYKEYGGTFDPFGWWGAENMVHSERVLGLYLKAGGAANENDNFGRPALLAAMAITKVSKLGSRKDDAEDGDGREICLLTPLIRAGADIYYIEAEDGTGDAWTLTDIAFYHGIEDAWFDALDSCGFDLVEVCHESARRLDAFNKLHGAKRSGVDVSIIIDQPESSGLRYRGSRASVEVDV
jgi:hypothetical protein